MASEGNALGGLAERLASNKVLLVEGDDFPIRLSKDAVKDFSKARRIIAELAKVYDKPRGVLSFMEDCVDAVDNSRKIAEEGADNGK